LLIRLLLSLKSKTTHYAYHSLGLDEFLKFVDPCSFSVNNNVS